MQQIKHFSTLSPIPGFRAWLDPVLAKGDDAIFTPQELREVKSIKAGGSSGALLLKEILDSTWHTDPKQTDKLKTVLVRLCAEYLMKEKKGKKAALDPVAHFHLTNGARLERINWLGDTSGKGLKQSAGLMVNYYYDLADIDQNHEKYATSGTIAASRAVKLLTK